MQRQLEYNYNHRLSPRQARTESVQLPPGGLGRRWPFGRPCWSCLSMPLPPLSPLAPFGPWTAELLSATSPFPSPSWAFFRLCLSSCACCSLSCAFSSQPLTSRCRCCRVSPLWEGSDTKNGYPAQPWGRSCRQLTLSASLRENSLLQ